MFLAIQTAAIIIYTRMPDVMPKDAKHVRTNIQFVVPKCMFVSTCPSVNYKPLIPDCPHIWC